MKPEALISFVVESNVRAICAGLGMPAEVIVSAYHDPEQGYAGKLGRSVGKLVLPLAGVASSRRWRLAAPCSSTDCPCSGSRVVIRSGENGLLVPVNDEDALANGTKLLLLNGGCAARMAVRVVIRDGENGILNPVSDIDALHQTMERIAGDSCFAEKLPRNSRKI